MYKVFLVLCACAVSVLPWTVVMGAAADGEFSAVSAQRQNAADLSRFWDLPSGATPGKNGCFSMGPTAHFQLASLTANMKAAIAAAPENGEFLAISAQNEIQVSVTIDPPHFLKRLDMEIFGQDGYFALRPTACDQPITASFSPGDVVRFIAKKGKNERGVFESVEMVYGEEIIPRNVDLSGGKMTVKFTLAYLDEDNQLLPWTQEGKANAKKIGSRITFGPLTENP